MPKEQRKGVVRCLAFNCSLQQFLMAVSGFHGAKNVNKTCCYLNVTNISVSNSIHCL